MSDLSQVILGIAGAVLSLIFSYVPAVKDWFDAQPNKGLIMLGFVVLVGGVYFGLGCVPVLAEFLKIALACDVPSFLLLVQAIIAIAVGNQLAFLFTRNGAK